MLLDHVQGFITKSGKRAKPTAEPYDQQPFVFLRNGLFTEQGKNQSSYKTTYNIAGHGSPWKDTGRLKF